MSDLIAPLNTVRFTINREPRRPAERKTIQRLMRMQPDIQRRLSKLATRRRLQDNRPYIRAGVEWVDRAKATKLTRVAAGETFTLTLTPQVIPDVKSVQRYLSVEKG